MSKLIEAEDKLTEAIANFLNVDANRINVDSYETEDGYSIFGYVDLKYLRLDFDAWVSEKGDGYIIFELNPDPVVKLDKKQSTVKGFKFDIDYWRIIGKYAEIFEG